MDKKKRHVLTSYPAADRSRMACPRHGALHQSHGLNEQNSVHKKPNNKFILKPRVQFTLRLLLATWKLHRPRGNRQAWQTHMTCAGGRATFQLCFPIHHKKGHVQDTVTMPTSRCACARVCELRKGSEWCRTLGKLIPFSGVSRHGTTRLPDNLIKAGQAAHFGLCLRRHNPLQDHLTTPAIAPRLSRNKLHADYKTLYLHHSPYGLQ